MDINGFSTNSNMLADVAAGSGELPRFTDAKDAAESSRWTDRLTEAQKEHIILECKDAKSKKQVEKIIEEKVPYGEMSTFLDEVKETIL